MCLCVRAYVCAGTRVKMVKQGRKRAAPSTGWNMTGGAPSSKAPKPAAAAAMKRSTSLLAANMDFL